MTNSQKCKLKLPKIRSATLSERKARKGWLFVLPFVIGILLIYLPIIIDSICVTSSIPPEASSRSSRRCF